MKESNFLTLRRLFQLAIGPSTYVISWYSGAQWCHGNIKALPPPSSCSLYPLLWECHVLPSWLGNLGWKVTGPQAAAEGST